MSTHARGVLAVLLITAAANLATAQQPPRGNPNWQKYSDTGLKPATGRAGSATLEARALLNKTGALQVEASTGSLENGTHAGNIDKVQLKMFAGGRTAVANFNNLIGGGYWTEIFAGLSRGDQVQLQTNISGIDPARSGVVTVSTKAALRPDIAVTSVTGAAEATPQSAVRFLATVTEKNGDVGARTDCVLSIDDRNVDVAEGIWVDAAGTVSCGFSYVFTTAGSYAVKVSAASVNPGDWDVDNNVAETSIVVIEPGKRLTRGTMQASHLEQEWEYHAIATSGPDYRFDTYGSRSYSHASLWGWTQAPAAAMQRVDVSLSANGVVQHTASLTPMPHLDRDYDMGNRFSSCRRFDSGQYTFEGNGNHSYVSTGDWAEMCTSGDIGKPETHDTWAYYQRVAGMAVYYSKDYDGYYGNTWFSNTHYKYGNGENLAWKAGMEVRLKVSFVDAVGMAITADQSVVLEDRGQSNQYSGTWYDARLNRTVEWWSRETGKHFTKWKYWY